MMVEERAVEKTQERQYSRKSYLYLLTFPLKELLERQVLNDHSKELVKLKKTAA